MRVAAGLGSSARRLLPAAATASAAVDWARKLRRSVFIMMLLSRESGFSTSRHGRKQTGKAYPGSLTAGSALSTWFYFSSRDSA